MFIQKLDPFQRRTLEALQYAHLAAGERTGDNMYVTSEKRRGEIAD